MSDVSVLAGGWSVVGEGVDVKRLPGLLIGVNEAALLAPSHMIVSMDRLFVENRWGRIVKCTRPTWLRRSAVQNISDRPAWLTVYECDHQSGEFSDNPARLNGSNSGFHALNLAYQKRPARVFLFGFDMCRGPKGEAYWHANYPWAPRGATSAQRYAEWNKQFARAAESFRRVGAEVFNVSERSAITVFRKLPWARLAGVIGEAMR